MAHVRTQIRTLAKSILEENLPDNYRVFSSRKSAINHRSDSVLVDMAFNNDQTREEETMNDYRVRIASLQIRIQRSGSEEELDDLLDQDEVRIINAFNQGDWSSLLEEPPEQIQAQFLSGPEGGNILGALVLRFDLEYRIDRTDPEATVS
jgi:hypothetical protein